MRTGGGARGPGGSEGFNSGLADGAPGGGVNSGGAARP